MKIRQGFVSNSSSSSFILKTSLTKDELKENVKKFIHAWVEYQKTMSPNNIKRYSEKYIDANIDECIDYIDVENDTIDDFLKEWYECNNFDNANMIIYADENYIPDTEDFWAFLQYGCKDTRVIDYSVHMG